MSSAADRLALKVEGIVAKSPNDQDLIDRRINQDLDMNEILTLGLMPVNARLRTYVVGCLMRDTKRKRDAEKLKEQVKEDELVPVEVHGGGKCKITVYMTKEGAARERGR